MQAYAVDVPQHIIVPESKNRPAIGFKAGGTVLIVTLIRIVAMLRAINLNDQTMQWARKVNDEPGNRHLPAEAQVH